MSFMNRLTALVAMLTIGGAATAMASADNVWTVEDGSSLGFSAKQQDVPVPGSFEVFDAEILFDPDDLESSRLKIDIDVTSITTGHAGRDATLNSPSFFDSAQWPRAIFESTELVRTGDGQYEALGMLTIRDVTREVTLPFTLEIEDDPDDPTRQLARARGELVISRLDYGVGQGDWASTVTVADEVVIAIDITASKPKTP